MSTPALTLYRDGLVSFNGEAARAIGKSTAVVLTAPSAPGAHWLMLPVADEQPGALRIYTPKRDARRRFRAYALASAAFALLPAGQKTLTLAMVPADEKLFRLTVA
jgi:hypothetical protein